MQHAPQQQLESHHQTSAYSLQGGGAKRHNRRRLFFESLEGRELLAVDMWQNPSDAMDVNGDGSVAPSDVLGIVNTMNEPTLETASSLGAASGMFPDVNGDGTVTETDSALIVAQLNQSPPPSGSTSSSTPPPGGGSSKLYYLPPTLDADFTSAPGVIPGVAFEGSLIALHYHVFQPDGDELTTVDMDWGDGTPVESMTITGGWLGAGQHIYVDDNPTNTPQDQYAITITASDADGSVQKLLLATVKNADPVVMIDSITAIDSVSPGDGGTDGQIDETEGFIVKGTITDAGINDTFPVAELTADINFDGTIDTTETYSLTLIKEPDGVWKFEQSVEQVLDDGPWTDGAGNPAWNNETSSDPITVSVVVVDDDTGTDDGTATPSVHNIEAAFKDDVFLLYDLDPQGDLVSATVHGSIVEPGAEDFHRLSVLWGDGAVGDGLLDPLELNPGVFSFQIHRIFSSGQAVSLSSLFPIQAELWDDDSGIAQVQLGDCGCGCGPTVPDGGVSIDPEPTVVSAVAGGTVHELHTHTAVTNGAVAAPPAAAAANPQPPSSLNADGDIEWTHIANGATVTKKSVTVATLPNNAAGQDVFGKTTSNPSKAKFELKFDKPECKLSIKTLVVPLDVKIAESVGGVILPQAEIDKTIAHEKAHVDAYLKHQEKLQSLATTFVGVFNGRPLAVRQAKGPYIVLQLDAIGTKFLKQTASLEAIRQTYHLDHLAEKTRDVQNGAVVEGPTTYTDLLDEAAFVAKVNRQLRQTFTGFGEAKTFLDDNISKWDTWIESMFTKFTAFVRR